MDQIENFVELFSWSHVEEVELNILNNKVGNKNNFSCQKITHLLEDKPQLYSGHGSCKKYVWCNAMSMAIADVIHSVVKPMECKKRRQFCLTNSQFWTTTITCTTYYQF